MHSIVLRASELNSEPLGRRSSRDGPAGRAFLFRLVLAFVVVAGLLFLAVGIRDNGTKHGVSAVGRLSDHGPYGRVSDRPATLSRSDFGIFSTPAEPLPHRVSSFLRSEPQAQRIKAAPWPIWTVRRPGAICLVGEEKTVEVTCTPDSVAERRGIYLASIMANHDLPAHVPRVVIGLVPDWARRVRLYTPGRPMKSIRVRENAFVLEDQEPIPPSRISLVPKSPGKSDEVTG